MTTVKRIKFGNYQSSGKQLLLVEDLTGGTESTHVADCANDEIATMLAKAANEWAEQRAIIEGSSLDEDHKRAMIEASGLDDAREG